jgi:hypothetical protein
MVMRSFGTNRYVKSATIAAGLYFAGISLGFAASQSPCGIRQLVKRDGWDIPGLAGASVVSNGSPPQPGDRISVAILRPGATASSVLTVSCVPDEPGRVEVREQAIKVLELRKYSVLGRVFAYRVNAEDVSIEGGVDVALGAAEVLMYYDVHGTGVFELREYGSRVPYRVFLPDWVSALPKEPRN